MQASSKPAWAANLFRSSSRFSAWGCCLMLLVLQILQLIFEGQAPAVRATAATSLQSV